MRWIAPAECPQAGAFGNALREQLPDANVRERIAAIDGQVKRFSKRGYGLSLSVQVQTQVARRRLSAENCEELLRAAVWLVVLAVGPAGAQERSDASEGEEPDAQATTPGSDGKSIAAGAEKQSTALPSSAGATATARADGSKPSSADTKLKDNREDAAGPAKNEREKSELEARLAAFGGVSAGTGAKVQGALGVWAGLSVGALHTRVALVNLLPANQDVMGGGHVRVWSLALGLSECALWGQRVQVGPCVGIEGLRTAAHSKDFGRAVNRSVLWAALDVGLQFVWPLTRSLELNISGTLGVPITPRPRFTVAGVGSVASAARLSEQAQLGLIYVVHRQKR